MRNDLSRFSRHEYGKTLSVRMTDEQYERFRRYQKLTAFDKRLYFHHLIWDERITSRPQRGFDPFTGFNMICSNVRQIVRHERANQLDRQCVAELKYLCDALSEQIFQLSCQE